MNPARDLGQLPAWAQPRRPLGREPRDAVDHEDRTRPVVGPLLAHDHYHHFGSKLGLYGLARVEAERRLLDRMEGAVAARSADGPAAALRAALLVGFDFVVAQEVARLLGEAHPDRDPLADPVAGLAAKLLDGGRTPIARMIAAAWREALVALGDGVPPERARAGLAALSVDEAPGVSPPRSSRSP